METSLKIILDMEETFFFGRKTKIENWWGKVLFKSVLQTLQHLPHKEENLSNVKQ